MANHHSAKVRIRRNARRTTINGERIGRIRTYVKKVEAAIAAGDKPAAQAAFRTAQPEMHRGIDKGSSGMGRGRSEEHTSELQSLMRISYAVFCLKKNISKTRQHKHHK